MTQDKKNKNKNREEAVATGSGDTETIAAKREEAAPTASKESKESKAGNKKGKENPEDDFSIVLPMKHHHMTPDQYRTIQPTNSLPLFIYGSLLLPHILHSATGEETPMIELVKNTTGATLHGYRRHAIANASFPAIVPNASHSVSGALVLGLSDEERESVKSFESGMYDRVTVDVEIEMVAGDVPEGWLLKTETVKAETYVWNYSVGATFGIVPVEEREWSIAPLVKGAWVGVGGGELESEGESG
ncbi:hypothetical protein FGG08_000976 [Glutinoglossum americanum]|uniref:Putative gamma-glutamylcyclotransferase n=1 Tax=Glutinoglossum americanum TaxID=1670608 RepID=A0A9P8IEB5_9PEZI|nr:hypothetical protein FGG08_000976 [Glutinoglossum americanum]